MASPKVTREWTSPDGIRCVDVEGGDGPMVDGRDLGKWLLSMDPRDIRDADKRARFERFQREAAQLEPAAQYRLAIEMLNESGAGIPAEMHTLRPVVLR